MLFLQNFVNYFFGFFGRLPILVNSMWLLHQAKFPLSEVLFYLKYLSDATQPHARYYLNMENLPNFLRALIKLRNNLIQQHDFKYILNNENYHLIMRLQSTLLLKRGGSQALEFTDIICEIRERCGYFYLTVSCLNTLVVAVDRSYNFLYDLNDATILLQKHNESVNSEQIPYSALDIEHEIFFARYADDMDDLLENDRNYFLDRAQELITTYSATQILQNELESRTNAASIKQDCRYYDINMAQDALLIQAGQKAPDYAQLICTIRDRCGYFSLKASLIREITLKNNGFDFLRDLNQAIILIADYNNSVNENRKISYSKFLQGASIKTRAPSFTKEVEELLKICRAQAVLQDELESRTDAESIKQDSRYSSIGAAQNKLLLNAGLKVLECALYISEIRRRCGYFYLTSEFIELINGKSSIFYYLKDLNQATLLIEAYNNSVNQNDHISYDRLLKYVRIDDWDTPRFEKEADTLLIVCRAQNMLRDKLELRTDAASIKQDCRYPRTRTLQNNFLLSAGKNASYCALFINEIRQRCGYFYLDRVLIAIEIKPNNLDFLKDLNNATILIEGYNNSVNKHAHISYDRLIKDMSIKSWGEPQFKEEANRLLIICRAQGILKDDLEGRIDAASIKQDSRYDSIKIAQNSLLLNVGENASNCALLINEIRQRCGYFYLTSEFIELIKSKSSSFYFLKDLNQATLLIGSYNSSVSESRKISYELLLDSINRITFTPRFTTQANELLRVCRAQAILQDELESRAEEASIKQDCRYHGIETAQNSLLLKAGENASNCALLIKEIRQRCGYFFLTEELIKEITSCHPNSFDCLADLNHATTLIEDYNHSAELIRIPYNEFIQSGCGITLLSPDGSRLTERVEKLILVYPAVLILKANLASQYDRDEESYNQIAKIQYELLLVISKEEALDCVEAISEIRNRCGYFYLSHNFLQEIKSAHSPLAHFINLNKATAKIQEYNDFLEQSEQSIHFDRLLENLSADILNEYPLGGYFTEKVEILFKIHQAQKLLSDALQNENEPESIKQDGRYNKIEQSQEALLSVLASNAVIGAQIICTIRKKYGYFYLSHNVLEKITNTQSPLDHLKSLSEAIELLAQYNRKRAQQSGEIGLDKLFQDLVIQNLHECESKNHFLSIAYKLIMCQKVQMMLSFQQENSEVASAIGHESCSDIEEAQNNLLRKAGDKAIEWAQEIYMIRHRCGHYFLSQGFFQKLMLFNNHSVFDMLSSLNLATEKIEKYNQSVEESLRHSYEGLLNQETQNCSEPEVFTERFYEVMSQNVPKFNIPIPIIAQTLTDYLESQDREFQQRAINLNHALKILLKNCSHTVCEQFSEQSKYITQLISSNKDHIEWIDKIAEYSIAGCVNAPRNGFMEIFAWVQIALQPTFEEKIKHAVYAYLVNEARLEVNKFFHDEKIYKEHGILYPEVLNYTIEKVIKKINSVGSGSNDISWLGLYGNYSFLNIPWGVRLLTTPQKFLDEGRAGYDLVNRLYKKTIVVSFDTLKRTCRNAHHIFQYVWSVDLIKELNDTRTLHRGFCQIACEITRTPSTIITIKKSAKEEMSSEDYASFENFLRENFVEQDNEIIKLTDKDFSQVFDKSVEQNYQKQLLLSAEERFEKEEKECLLKKIRF